MAGAAATADAEVQEHQEEHSFRAVIETKHKAVASPHPPPTADQLTEYSGVLLPAGSRVYFPYVALIHVDTALPDWHKLLMADLIKCQARSATAGAPALPAAVAVIIVLVLEAPRAASEMITALAAGSKLLTSFFGSNLIETGGLSVPTVVISNYSAQISLDKVLKRVTDEQQRAAQAFQEQRTAQAAASAPLNITDYADSGDETEDDGSGMAEGVERQLLSVTVSIGKNHETNDAAEADDEAVLNSKAASALYHERKKKRLQALGGIVPLNECQEFDYTPRNMDMYILRNATMFYHLRQAIPVKDDGMFMQVYCCFCWTVVSCWEAPSRLVGQKFARHHRDCSKEREGPVPLPDDFEPGTNKDWIIKVLAEHEKAQDDPAFSRALPPKPKLVREGCSSKKSCS